MGMIGKLYQIYITGMFTNIVAKWPGSTHNSFVFSSSKIGHDLEENPTTFEEGWLLGDSGYPCKPYLMTSFLNPATGKQEAHNKAHVSTRVEIEQSFGWWKRRFHVLHSEVRMKPEKTCQIIGTCAVLHNIAILLKEPKVDYQLEEDNQPDMVAYRGPENGKLIRDHICETYF